MVKGVSDTPKYMGGWTPLYSGPYEDYQIPSYPCPGNFPPVRIDEFPWPSEAAKIPQIPQLGYMKFRDYEKELKDLQDTVKSLLEVIKNLSRRK